MNDNKVVVKSTVNAQVGIELPEYRFKHTWGSKNAKVLIDKDLLNDIMFDPGVEYMFKTGILYIEDMQVKKDLNLEPQDAKEPTNIIVLPEEQIKRQLTLTPFHEFKEVISRLSNEQKLEVINYAIKNEILPSMDKTEYLTKTTGIDIMSAIRLNRQNKE